MPSAAINYFSDRLSLLTEAADRYVKSRGFVVEQRNGQRQTICVTLPELPRDITDNEVFVGKLPRELFEDELLPFMEQAGQVYKIRLMMDFGRTNRGYGFVRYVRPQDAAAACAKLNGTRIRPNDPPVGVLPSFDNKRLFLGNLPNCNKLELLKQLSEVLEDVESVDFPDDASPLRNSRYAFVTFKSHTAATKARRLLVPGNVKICGRDITCDWAKTDRPINRKINSFNQHNSIIVSNLDFTNVPFERFKHVLEIGNRCKVIAMQPCGTNSLMVAYERPDLADIVLEAIVIYPMHFSCIALPNQILVAERPYHN